MVVIYDYQALEGIKDRWFKFRVKIAGENLKDYVKLGMETTERDTSKSYLINTDQGAMIHHPSFPGEFPAVMLGNLINSLDYEIEDDVFRFGVLPKGSESIGYALYLEMGTMRAAPRPWLTFAMEHAKRII
jgi:hypothetical protein